MRHSLRLAWFAGSFLAGLAPALADGVDDATALLRKGAPDQALARVETHLKDNPKDARGRFLRAVIADLEGAF